MSATLIIVPTYNERENLPRIVEKLLSLPVAVEVLAVDGNSPDGTGVAGGPAGGETPAVPHSARDGQERPGRAYIAGFKWALEHKYEFIFEMDSDFQHNPDDIPMFLKAAEETGADVVLGRGMSGACGS